MRREQPVVFDCNGDRLVGILHEGAGDARIGIVIIVGGPQYRVGAHRQFVLMARAFAEAGIPVLRFDYRGMGDADGQGRNFEAIDEDIETAVGFLRSKRSSIERVFLMGLCDAASAALMHCSEQPRVEGLILLNPWVRSTQGQASAYVKHYYWRRLTQISFWRKLASGKLRVWDSLRDFSHKLRESWITERTADAGSFALGNFVDRMLAGALTFKGKTLVLLSGRDLTAAEFVDLCSKHRDWKAFLEAPDVQVERLPDADHTLSKRSDLDEAIECISRWSGLGLEE